MSEEYLHTQPLVRTRHSLRRTRHTLNLPGLDPHPLTLDHHLLLLSPPVPKPSIDAIPTVRVSSSGLPCAICTDDLSLGDEAKRLPCSHLYHPLCISPWLSLSNSCPVCRSPIPHDLPDLAHILSRVARDDDRGLLG